MLGFIGKLLRKPIFLIPTLIIVLVLGVLGYGKLFGLVAYSDGQRSGNLIKYSDKGIIANHGEGELLLNEFGTRSINAGSNSSATNTGGNVFVFNVTDSDLKQQMNQATGQNITVEYVEWLIAPWFYNGKYKATGVRVGGGAVEDGG